MKTRIRSFGRLPDMTEIQEITLGGYGLNVKVITLGAAIRDLKVSVGRVKNRRVVLGLDHLEDYINHSPFFGEVVGRCANRIARGRFNLDDKSIQVDQNENGKNHLHGGSVGFGKCPWKIAEHSDSHVVLELVSPDGDQGYPGTIKAQCTYRIIANAKLTVELTAETSAPTLVNLALHSYFNLDETPDIKEHSLQISADNYLPTSDDLIPTGEMKPVEDSRFDFREPRRIFDSKDASPHIYDHNYVLFENRQNDPVRIATLFGAQGLKMDVATTEPGLQFYDGNGVQVPVDGLQGHPYGPYSGVCLEPQVWPDSPNHSHFPSAVLRPRETYQQQTSYCFAEHN